MGLHLIMAVMATIGSSPVNVAGTAQTPLVGVADSTAVVLLTTDQVTSLVATTKALQRYWHMLEHAQLLETAESTVHKSAFLYNAYSFPVSVYDYPTLVKQDTALASIFSANDLTPTQFEPIQVTVYQALLVLCMSRLTKDPLPADSSTLGKNAVLVEAHRRDLDDVGIFVKYAGNQIVGLP